MSGTKPGKRAGLAVSGRQNFPARKVSGGGGGLGSAFPPPGARATQRWFYPIKTFAGRSTLNAMAAQEFQ